MYLLTDVWLQYICHCPRTRVSQSFLFTDKVGGPNARNEATTPDGDHVGLDRLRFLRLAAVPKVSIKYNGHDPIFFFTNFDFTDTISEMSG